MRRMKRYARRPVGPSRTWSDVSGAFGFAAVASTTQAILISLESPTNLTNLGSDPPEDLTLLRMVGDFSVSLSTSGIWRLGLLVQDRTWTANASGVDDNDKRVLWSQVYRNTWGAVMTFNEPGFMQVFLSPPLAAGGLHQATHLDIAPKVKIEAGKSLYVVAWEEQSGATFTLSSANMRVLYQRSGRR